jgi:hypothetical protein
MILETEVLQASKRQSSNCTPVALLRDAYASERHRAGERYPPETCWMVDEKRLASPMEWIEDTRRTFRNLHKRLQRRL